MIVFVNAQRRRINSIHAACGRKMKDFVGSGCLACFSSPRWLAGSRPGGRLAFFWLCRKKVSKERLFLGVGWADCVFLRWLAGFRPGSRVTFFWRCRKKVSKERFFAVFAWLAFFRSGGKPGFGPAAELLFFASPKKSNQKKGEPRPCRFAVPCATRSVRDTCKLASLKQCKCLDPNAAPLLSTA